MKPRALELTAFGPFGGTVCIDFDALASRSLFLVHGATGAGKTTLLDAMAFALYGVTSGGERNAKEMRSHHAPPGKRTEVTFTFDVRGHTYRVWRVPEQTRPRARGKGTTTTKSQVSLSVLGEGAEDDVATQAALDLDIGLEAWTELYDKAGDVEEKVVDLIGLTADQFRQVVLLPQGRFREFLLSSSRERQAILESLFGAERFAQIEVALKAEVERLRQSIRGEADRRTLLLEQAGVAPDADPFALRATQQTRAAQLSDELLAKEAAVAAAQRAAEASRTLGRARLEASEAAVALEALERQSEAQQAEADRLALAQKAQEATAAFQRFEEGQQRVQALAERQRDAEAALGQSKERRQAALAALEAQRERRDVEEQAASRRRELEGLATRIAAFKEAQASVREHEAAVAKAQRAVADAEHAAAEANATHTRTADDLDEARMLAEQQPTLQAAYLRLLSARKAFLRRGEVRERDSALKERLKKLIDDAAAAQDRLASAEAAREAAETAWLRGQAAELARGLADGEACPVCGSTDHPAPASAYASPDDAGHRRLKTAREKAEQERTKLMKLEGEAHQVEAERQSVATELGLLEDTLDEWAHAERDALEREVDRASAAIEEAERAGASLEKLAALVQEAAGAMKAATEKTVAARRQLEAARSQVEQSQAVAAERGAGLPTELLEEGALDAALADARAELAALERARTEAEMRATEAERQVAIAEETFRLSRAALTEAEDDAKARHAALNEALARAGLDEQGLMAARLSADEREARERALHAFHTALGSARDRLERAQAGVAALLDELGEVPAQPEAEAAAAAAADAHRAALAEQATLTAQLSQLDRALEGVRSTEDRTEALEKRYAVIGRVAEVALGDNPQKMTLQRFVLATLLDEVLQTASERLAQMSNGRFLLRRSMGGRSRRRALGLELSVFDHHTGTERPAATLSGGESFLAALALALGLADAVQARVGGGPLEAIFIDEGFGGLDPESLDLALSALSRITDSGRQVGIISHVAELRERIDARVHVTGGKRGSRVQIRTP